MTRRDVAYWVFWCVWFPFGYWLGTLLRPLVWQ